MRIAAILEYDGSGYSGWQWQEGTATVQGVVEAAFSKVANEPLRVITAGRTDTGVHATAQVIHFNTASARSSRSWVYGANSNLPDDVAVLWANEVDESFHARFDATGRHYCYIILNRKIRPTLLHQRVTWEYRPLDVARMQRAAQHLEGTHDFDSFRTVHCQAKSPVRELRHLHVERRGEFVFIHAYANAFLHHMVRNLAGVLMTIGAGEQEPDWAAEVLERKDRTQGGVTAAAQGLYLTAIEYPQASGIPRLSRECGLW
ncbi:MAG: tRNA pseudouridine(38-40) synthase TruA [Gammaproteobacteria bacterium]|nr:MAG: tRNA pseudouridine(38-40) synthase TruA [Gammaproteobacteria bacterium]